MSPLIPSLSRRKSASLGRRLVLGMLVLASFTSRATLFFTEQFNYPDGTQLGAVTGPWNTSTAGYGDNTSQIKVSAAAAQTVPTGLATAAYNGVDLKPAGSVKKTVAAFNGTTGVPNTDGNVVYASFLLNVRTLPAAGVTNMPVFMLHIATSASSGWGLEVDVTATGQIGVQKRAGGIAYAGGTPFATPGTHLIVVRYQFQSGADAVSLWVDPSSANYGVEPAPSAAATATTGSDVSSALTHVGVVSAGLATGPEYWIDEVRVATTWSEVTPADNQTYPPSISIDPQAASVYTGQSAFLSVVADGTAPLSYQWYFNTNTPIADATNSLLSLTNLQLSDAGAYAVVVTNAYGAATSAVAQITVSVPVAPAISSQPQDQTVHPGGNATFSVSASGSEPLNYQWYFDTNTAISGANSASLAVNNVQTTNAGSYHVIVNNFAGSVTSAVAMLILDLSPVAPTFVSQPASAVALTGGNASFSAAASGTAPIYYQWLKNGSVIGGATNPTLTLTNVQADDSASYALRASNSVGVAVSSNATLTVTIASSLPRSAFNLTGFAYQTTGGGVIPETDPAYRKVTNALDLANAILAANKTAGAVKVIEIMNDLDLGWNEVGTTVQTLASTPFRAHTAPLLHPRLLVTGVSLIDIKPKGGLTIFSANGATIRHATFNIKGCSNVIVRNLKFDEMWEWDESTKGQYDRNDWDFIDLGNGGSVSNIWVDHCTFTKSYDGILDTKAGSSAITISWCKYTGDDGATNLNSFVWQQINSLESNRTSYAFYNFLRNNGFSPTDIATIIQGHDKTHLAGANSLDSGNATISMTFHHLWLNNVWDRCVPRLRGGNVHDYNLYVDDTLALAAKNLRNARAAAMSTNNQNTLNNTYDFNPPLNGAISTESGALLVEKSVYIDCLTPLRNNQTDPTDPTYTGKILALDSIYQMNNVTFRGNSTDPGGVNTFGPVQAAIIPFSWNLPGNQLPYTYTPDDPGQLSSIVPAGAGAGVVNWDKTNWLLTVYPPTAPTITAQPQSLHLAPGDTANFIVAASGSAPLSYQWYFNTNTPIMGATSSTLMLANVQSTNGGVYSVTVTNSAGSVTSALVVLTVSTNATPPQLSGLISSPGTFGFSVDGPAGQTYLVQVSTNLVDWTTVLTTNPATLPFVWTDSAAADIAQRFYRVKLSP